MARRAHDGRPARCCSTCTSPTRGPIPDTSRLRRRGAGWTTRRSPGPRAPTHAASWRRSWRRARRPPRCRSGTRSTTACSGTRPGVGPAPDHPEGHWAALAAVLSAPRAACARRARRHASSCTFPRAATPPRASACWTRWSRRSSIRRRGRLVLPVVARHAGGSRRDTDSASPCVTAATSWWWRRPTRGRCDGSTQEHNLVGPQDQLLTGFPRHAPGRPPSRARCAYAVQQVPADRGAGVWWWEPAWISAPRAGSPWENCALFDSAPARCCPPRGRWRSECYVAVQVETACPSTHCSSPPSKCSFFQIGTERLSSSIAQRHASNAGPRCSATTTTATLACARRHLAQPVHDRARARSRTSSQASRSILSSASSAMGS